MAATPARLRLGTRGSALARWQAGEVRRRLAGLGVACQIEVVQTSGDRNTAGSLAAIGGKGLFTQEIEDGLRRGQLDLAVHSLKDVPTLPAPGLELIAMLEREDPRDVLVAAPGLSLATLPAGARIGTGSLRRQAQGLALRPDLDFQPIRGNVDTRLRRWREGNFDALVLAAAGLRRLGLGDAIAEWMPTDLFCPAAGQGVIALQCRAGDAATIDVARRLHHLPTGVAVTAERALLARLECGCQAPVGAYARLEGDALLLSAVVVAPRGTPLVRHTAAGSFDEPAALGHRVAEALLQNGAGEILSAIYT